jgi:hypothetical protein
LPENRGLSKPKAEGFTDDDARKALAEGLEDRGAGKRLMKLVENLSDAPINPQPSTGSSGEPAGGRRTRKNKKG